MDKFSNIIFRSEHTTMRVNGLVMKPLHIIFTGTFGRYKRKRSALNLTDGSQTDAELDVIPSRCMKSLDDSELRQRRASADPHDWPGWSALDLLKIHQQ